MRTCFMAIGGTVLAIGMFLNLSCAAAQNPAISTPDRSPVQDSTQEPGYPIRDVDRAKERLAATLIDIEGVVGIGVGECQGQDCIMVFVEKRTPELSAAIPTEYEGFPVEVGETGEVTAPPANGAK